MPPKPHPTLEPRPAVAFMLMVFGFCWGKAQTVQVMPEPPPHVKGASRSQQRAFSPNRVPLKPLWPAAA